MSRSVSEVARILGVDSQRVKTWAWTFKEHLSSHANPTKGQPREFTESDLFALMYVASRWERDPDIESIHSGLNTEEQFCDEFAKVLYRHTPILQEPPGELDESWTHGMLLNGGGVDAYLELARSYKSSADALLDSALKIGEPRDFGYPVLYAYRHVLELYLKVLGEIDERTHSLKRCVQIVENRHSARLPSKRMPEPIRTWILQFDAIDPLGTAFRYADDDAKTLRDAEYWVDFNQIKFAMGIIFTALDRAILLSGVRTRSAQR
jgi:hypothetical protein